MRMRSTAVSLIAATALLAVLTATAAAHEITVTNPQTGEVVVEGHWVGGFTVPEPAQDAPPIFGPFRLPPSHAHGLPMACTSSENSPAIEFAAPPFFTGCVHGLP
jgi:hypothetical protein